MPNPYDNLPKDEYMREHMNAISGGSPLIEDPSPEGMNQNRPITFDPTALDVPTYDYTSARLKWYCSGVSYVVFINGEDSYRLPGGMREFTLGGLDPGKQYTFQVFALGPGGLNNVWTTSDKNTITTPNLPNGRTVTSVQVLPGDTVTTFKARIVVPYGFVRLYIFANENFDHCLTPGWPINYNIWNYVCAYYLIENDNVYQYNGPEGVSPIPWAWEQLPGTVDKVQDFYDFTWTVPIGMSKVDPNRFVLQCEGYGPSQNVFHTCPQFHAGPEGDGNYCL
jgi:hypothetical protein